MPSVVNPIVVVPKEGLKAWSVVFFSFSCCCISSSHTYGFSVFYLEMCKELQIHPYDGLLALSLSVALMSMMGPFGSAFINRFSFSLALYVGGTLNTLCFLACYFSLIDSSSFPYLLAFYSVGAGVGSNLILLVGLIAPTMWFTKMRVLAISLASSGAGVPGIIGPLLLSKIEVTGGWKVCFLFLAGIASLAIPLGILMPHPPGTEVEVESPVRLSVSSPQYSKITVKEYIGGSRYTLKPKKGKRKDGPHLLEREDIFYQGDVKRVLTSEEPLDYALQVTRVRHERRRQTVKLIRRFCQFSCGSIKELFALHLFKSLNFNIIYILNFLSGFVLSYSYIQFGIWKKDESISVTSIFVMSFCSGMVFGRIFLGIIQLKLPLIKSGPCLIGAYIILFILSDIIIGLKNYITLLYCSCFVYGFLGGIFMPIRSLLIIDYLGLKNLTPSMGLMFLSQGTGFLFGPSCLEAITRATNDMGAGFLVAAIIYLIMIVFISVLIHFGKVVT